MVLETNKYAEQEINKYRPLKRSSRLNDWKPINADDMRNFIGVRLHMEYVKLSSFEIIDQKTSSIAFWYFLR